MAQTTLEVKAHPHPSAVLNRLRRPGLSWSQRGKRRRSGWRGGGAKPQQRQEQQASLVEPWRQEAQEMQRRPCTGVPPAGPARPELMQDFGGRRSEMPLPSRLTGPFWWDAADLGPEDGEPAGAGRASSALPRAHCRCPSLVTVPGHHWLHRPPSAPRSPQWGRRPHGA